MTEQQEQRVQLEHTAVGAARRAKDGTSLKLRYHRDASKFAITESLAPLGSGIGWYAQGELAIIGLRIYPGTTGTWRIRHYDGHTWIKPDLTIDEAEIEETVRQLLADHPRLTR